MHETTSRNLRLLSWYGLTTLVFAVSGELQPSRTSIGRLPWLIEVAAFLILGTLSLVLVLRRGPRFSSPVIVISGAFLALLTFHLLYGPPYFRSDPISSRVVDDRTGVPVSGARIRAKWRLIRFGTLEEDLIAGVLYTEATTSGIDGSFSLHGWGPTIRPFMTWMAPDDPTITIIAPSGVKTVLNNAEPMRLWADGTNPNRYASRRSSNWRLEAPAQTVQYLPPSVTATAADPGQRSKTN